MRRRKRLIRSRRTYKDSTPDENLQAGRAGAAERGIDLFDVDEGTPLVPEDLHELARHINSRPIDREEDFITFDYHLCRLSHTRSLIDLCLGELLSAFKKADGKACGEMGYSKLDDFADEHLSFSGRLASEMILNFQRLQALPLTREAYIKGEIVKSALRLLLRVATKENEAELLAEIRELSVREIDELVKVKLRTARVCGRQKNLAGGDAEGDVTEKANSAGDSAAVDFAEVDAKVDSAADMPGGAIGVVPGEVLEVEPSMAGAVDVSGAGLFQYEQASEEMPSEEADREEGSGVVMKLNVPRTLALTWDFALEHFRENDKTNGPLYGFVEALVSSFLDSTADLVASKVPEADVGDGSEAGSGACTLLDGGMEAISEDGPAFAGGREVPLLHTDAIWDFFPSEREMRARGRDVDLKPAETGDCRPAEAGSGKPEDSSGEYPDPQNEERLRQIRKELALQPFVVKLPEEYSEITLDSYALARRIIRVASMRQSIDYHIGWFLKAVRDRHLFRIMEFSKIEDYAKARINISASTTFRLIRLVSYFSNHPVIEKVFLRRRITREQAYLIASLEDGRHERIWLDFAMSRPARELRDEVNRMLRIKEYDYFAPHNYALLPGFRYITDDRYDALSDEMKDILRTGAWYQGPGSQWPLESNDEHFLEKDFADKISEESDITRLSKHTEDSGKSSDREGSSRLSKCTADSGKSSDQAGSSRLSKCAADQCESSDQAGSSRLSKCAADSGKSSDQAESSRPSKCAAEIETGACQCREADRQCADDTIEQARTLCTLPDKHRPAATLLLDVLESLGRQNDGYAPAVSIANEWQSQRSEPAMSIRFFIPRGLYGVWNEAVRRYVSLISYDDGVELLINNEGVENFIALMLTEYLLAEKAHQKAGHNNKVLERDGYKCQVPGCSNRRNIHAHHLEFRSHGGSDASRNLLSLCTVHHLWILHVLHGLKVEGTAPEDLTFTFGPCSSPEGHPFMLYRSGRKVLSPASEETGCSR